MVRPVVSHSANLVGNSASPITLTNRLGHHSKKARKVKPLVDLGFPLKVLRFRKRGYGKNAVKKGSKDADKVTSQSSLPSDNIRLGNSRFWDNFVDPSLEAKHTVELAKVLGLSCGDNEDFLISSFAEREASNCQCFQKLQSSKVSLYKSV